MPNANEIRLSLKLADKALEEIAPGATAKVAGKITNELSEIFGPGTKINGMTVDQFHTEIGKDTRKNLDS